MKYKKATTLEERIPICRAIAEKMRNEGKSKARATVEASEDTGYPVNTIKNWIAQSKAFLKVDSIEDLLTMKTLPSSLKSPEVVVHKAQSLFKRPYNKRVKLGNFTMPFATGIVEEEKSTTQVAVVVTSLSSLKEVLEQAVSK